MSETKAIARPPFGAWLTDDATRSNLVPAARDHGWDESSVRTGGITSAVRTLSSSPCPEILIVDVSESRNIRNDMALLADVCDPETVVIAVGTENDVSLYRDLLHAGVMDYLVKPITDDLFQSVVASARDIANATTNDAPAAAHDPEARRQIMVLGLRGGLGASSIASNLAYTLSQRPQPTVLVDMDLHFGVAALMFDLEPGRGLTDALENPTRVDGLFLERAVVKPTTQLSILAAEAPVGSLGHHQDGALQSLIGVLADAAPVQVIDMPRHALPDHLDAVQALTDVVIVTDLSLCGARDTIRMIGYLEKTAPGITVHVVASKTGAAGGEVNRADFENSIERSLLATVPNDPKVFLNAARLGKPVVEVSAGSKAAQALREIALTLDPSASDDESAKSGFIKKLFAKAG